jgi:hypothetical protein
MALEMFKKEETLAMRKKLIGYVTVFDLEETQAGSNNAWPSYEIMH